MSTRSVIARKKLTGHGFAGVYHHWDGYPSGLGRTLFQKRNGRFKGDTAEMLAYLIDQHPAGWSTINGDTEEKAYTDKPWTLDEKNASDCGCEWAYVFDKGGKRMEVWASYCDPEGKHAGQKMIGAFGCGDPKATWKMVASIDLDGPEPDWKKIEAEAQPQEETV